MKKSNIGDKSLSDKGIPDGNGNTKDAQVAAYEQGRPLPRNSDAVITPTVRPDPQFASDKGNVQSTAAAPEHAPNDIEGVIQEKRGPSAPITEKLPTESDLKEGKITPAAVNKPAPHEGERSAKVYHRGVTQADIDQGKISPSAVREQTFAERNAVNNGEVVEDQNLHDMVTTARNSTALGRLNYAELLEAFKTLEASGYTVRKAA